MKIKYRKSADVWWSTMPVVDSPMPTRRQEKVARVVREVVSDAIANHLSDPRIVGFVSVTKVDMAPDLRSADVYLSIFSNDPPRLSAQANVGAQSKTFEAIIHAKSRIQSLLADRMQSKFCPVLHFYRDEQFKKTLETMKLIDRVADELRKTDSVDEPRPCDSGQDEKGD